VSFAQEFVGLIQRRRIRGSDAVDIDRVVDHTAVHTAAPRHAAVSSIHGPPYATFAGDIAPAHVV
jgi:hypothetical protein